LFWLDKVLTNAGGLLPAALRELVGTAFLQGLVYVQAEDQAHRWDCPLMKA